MGNIVLGMGIVVHEVLEHDHRIPRPPLALADEAIAFSKVERFVILATARRRCSCVCACVRARACSTCTCVRVYTYICIYIHTPMYMYTYAYTYTHTKVSYLNPEPKTGDALDGNCRMRHMM